MDGKGNSIYQPSTKGYVTESEEQSSSHCPKSIQTQGTRSLQITLLIKIYYLLQLLLCRNLERNPSVQHLIRQDTNSPVVHFVVVVVLTQKFRGKV